MAQGKKQSRSYDDNDDAAQDEVLAELEKKKRAAVDAEIEAKEALKRARVTSKESTAFSFYVELQQNWHKLQQTISRGTLQNPKTLLALGLLQQSIRRLTASLNSTGIQNGSNEGTQGHAGNTDEGSGDINK